MSSGTTVLIEPRDPVIFRDGKPFSEGAISARSIGFPMPSTIAGVVRGRAKADWDFGNPDEVKKLRQIVHKGPFLAYRDDAGGRWGLALTPPADLVIAEGQVHPLRPLRSGSANAGGCDLPDGMLPLLGAPMSKPDPGMPSFWRMDRVIQWLSGERPSLSGLGFGRLPEQSRIHVAIDGDSQTARDGHLFSTHGLEFLRAPSRDVGDRAGGLPASSLGIVSRVEADGMICQWPTLAPLGGERRLAYWSTLDNSQIQWPEKPRFSFEPGSLIRVMLATPGAFQLGWRPGWTRTGHVIGREDLELELVAAAVPRFHAISGWDLENGGPKSTRFLAPAGSVYFFVVKKGDVGKLWMESICDREEDRRDGFGLALIGAAEWHKD